MQRSVQVVAAALIAVALLVPGGFTAYASGTPADGDLVRFASIEHEIDFGRGINVTLSADLTSTTPEIVEVRAVFATGGDRGISSYAYPDFAVSNFDTAQGKLTASFTIDTGVQAYYPPGTEFDLFFEFTDSNGLVSTTITESILYLDPTKNWQVLSAPGIPLEFHYYGFSRSTTEGLAERVAVTWRPIAASLGLDPESPQFDRRFRAVIYPNVQEFSSAAPPTSAASSDGVFFGGFAMERYGVFILGGPSAASVIHELTHLLVNTKVSSPLSPGVPSWLHEGLAQYFEAGSSSGYTSRLSSAAASNRLITLRNRNTVPSLGSEIGLFYTQVGSFVGGLIESRGAEPMAETLRLIDEGNVAASAIESAYGTPLWQLENEWRVRLGASELPPPLEPAPPIIERATPTAQPTGTTTAAPNANSPTAQVTATVQSTQLPDIGVGAGEGNNPEEDGFNWNGPLIGLIAAAVVFAIWSFRVNRRRFGTRRR